MKIEAIRVRDVGHFSSPMALEGLSGELDVLAAGNEAGKSTLFRALEAAFYEKHTATGKRVQGITPRAGGSPLVEVDFSVNGDAWRVTKQFGRGRRSMLAPAGGAGLTLRGADADEALARLVGLSDTARGNYLPGRLGFLWVGQGGALEPLPPQAERGEAAALQRIVEREVSTVTGGSLVRQLRADVADELAVLKTPARSVARANGPWDVANKRAAELATLLARAGEARRVAGQRRETIVALKSRRAELTAAVRMAGARQALADAAACRDRAVGARRLLRDAQVRVAGQEAALKDAERAAAALQAQIDEFDALEAGVRSGEPKLAAAEQALGRYRAETEAITAQGERLALEERLAQAAVYAAEQAEVAVQARTRLVKLEASLDAAEALAGEIAEKQAAMAGGGIDGAAIEALVTADAALKRASDALEAQAPRITIIYEPGATGPIFSGGSAVPAGVLPVADGLVTLEIPGVGVIEIAAAATADRAVHLTVRDEARGRLAHGLAALGVKDLAEAQARQRESVAAVSALDALTARLSGLAPGGAAALAAEVAAVRAGLARVAVEGDGVLERGDALAALEQVRGALEAFREDNRSRMAGLEPLLDAAGRARDDLDRSRRRLNELASELPPIDERMAALDRLKSAAASVHTEMSGALRELAAVRAAVPDEAETSALEARVKTLLAEQAQEATELQQNEVQLARLEGEDGQADQDGLAARVPEIEGELQRAKLAVARFEADVAALTLLAETIDAAEAENLDRFLTPVVRLLNPLLDLVFPGARLRLSGDFSVSGLERTGVLDDLDLLSGGTREQIAVLVRLAFAELLAQAGHAVPLILDDALVYTDDERLARVFKALARGAARHQVIVLTCHQNAFGALGGQRAGLVSWANCP